MSIVEDENGDVLPLKMTFKERTCGNKCAYIQYKCLRAFFVSVYFYFLPFTTILLTCLIPIIRPAPTIINNQTCDDQNLS